MKKKFLIIILVFLAKGVFSQCASDYIGIYGVRSCSTLDTITNYLWNSTITEVSTNKIIISNFHGIPNEVIYGIEDTIEVNLNCNIDSLYLEPILYEINGGGIFDGGNLIYSGSGALFQDSLIINYQQINPEDTQEVCLVYKKRRIIDNIKESTNDRFINIFPNPTNSFIYIDLNGISISRIDLFNYHGFKIFSYPEFKRTIDMSSFPIGFYFIRLTTIENETIVKKIMKK